MAKGPKKARPSAGVGAHSVPVGCTKPLPNTTPSVPIVVGWSVVVFQSPESLIITQISLAGSAQGKAKPIRRDNYCRGRRKGNESALVLPGEIVGTGSAGGSRHKFSGDLGLRGGGPFLPIRLRSRLVWNQQVEHSRQ
jgi:hypothetical protein